MNILYITEQMINRSFDSLLWALKNTVSYWTIVKWFCTTHIWLIDTRHTSMLRFVSLYKLSNTYISTSIMNQTVQHCSYKAVMMRLLSIYRAGTLNLWRQFDVCLNLQFIRRLCLLYIWQFIYWVSKQFILILRLLLWTCRIR